MYSGNFILRHSIQPYISIIIIVATVSLFAAYTMLSIRDYGSLVILPIGFLFLIGMIYIGNRYKIILYGQEIIQKASGEKDVIIKIPEITKIKNETSNTQTLLLMNRPFRRVVIYDEKGNKIDVSLKHFVEADIRKLMEIIHKQRPDLDFSPQLGRRSVSPH